MLYNILKLIHILAASFLIGTEINYTYNKRCNLILLGSAVSMLITGIAMMHMAMFSFHESWLLVGGLCFIVYVLCLLYSIFSNDFKSEDIIPTFRLNETNDFKSEDAQRIEKYVSTAESCKNYLNQLKMKFGISSTEKYHAKSESPKNCLDHLKMKIGIMPNFRLNQTNDFKSEDAQRTQKYVSTAETRKNCLDHLKMKIGIRRFRFVVAIIAMVFMVIKFEIG